MDASFTMKEPQKIEATMKITCTLQEWEDLRDQLRESWPSSDLCFAITDLLAKARKIFYTNEKND